MGPAPCHDCGTPLTWRGGSWTVHECRPVKCMTADEWRGWKEANNSLSQPAPTPCWDCTEAFARIMRATYRCNGTPGVVGSRRILPVNDPVTEARRARWRKAGAEYRARRRREAAA